MQADIADWLCIYGSLVTDVILESLKSSFSIFPVLKGLMPEDRSTMLIQWSLKSYSQKVIKISKYICLVGTLYL